MSGDGIKQLTLTYSGGSWFNFKAGPKGGRRDQGYNFVERRWSSTRSPLTPEERLAARELIRDLSAALHGVLEEEA